MNTATAITIAGLAALTPTVTCLIGIILSRQDLRDFRSEVNARFDKIDARFIQMEGRVDKINGDLKQFYA